MKALILGFGLSLLVSVNLFAQLPNEIDTTNNWEMLWSDDFDYPDSLLEERWISDNRSYEQYGFILCSRWRENVEVHDGILELKARKEERGGMDWTAGSIWTQESFTYGYFECRYKYAEATGTNNSFWLWPKIGVPVGGKAFELDINEGHYPNIINTNIHNWTDTLEDGSHEMAFEDYRFDGKEKLFPAYTHELEKPIKAQKVRLKSNHYTFAQVGDFRIYAPNKKGYPEVLAFEAPNEDELGLTNLVKDSTVQLSASGVFKTDPKYAKAKLPWASQIKGEKWLEITFDEPQEIGCIQFTNGWDDHGGLRNLIAQYTLEYFDGKEWQLIAERDGRCETDFSEEYHTYGFLWTEDEFKFYFDGKHYRTQKHELCHAPTNILLSLAILAWNIAGPVTDEVDGTSIKVDYVRYYKEK